MKSEDALKAFGRMVMANVRDPSIVASQQILIGECKAETDQVYREFVASLTEVSKQKLQMLLTTTIDTVLFNFLFMFEQQDRFLIATTGTDELLDLNEVSDGLSGELWGEYGWIEKYSDPKNYLEDEI